MVNALPAKSIHMLMPLKATSWPCFTPAMTASVNTAVGSAVLVAMGDSCVRGNRGGRAVLDSIGSDCLICQAQPEGTAMTARTAR